MALNQRVQAKEALRRIFAAVLVAAAILAPRLPDLDAFVTVDEATWLMRAGNFYYALGQRDFANTATAYHPAVTTTWIGVLGTMIEFPAYRGQGQGYFVKETSYAAFLDRFQVDPLRVLQTSRLIQVVIETGLLLGIGWYLSGLIGVIPTLVALLLLSFDPFLLGHTRVLAHEGLLSLLVIFSLASALRYLFHQGSRVDWLLSAVTAALAMLTKSTATILVPGIGLLLILGYFRKDQPPGSPVRRLPRAVRTAGRGLAWMGAAAAVYFVAWPAMWSGPRAALTLVYGNAFSYAIEGHQAGFAGPSPYSEFDLDFSGTERYLTSILWRTTPVVWLGVGLALVALGDLVRRRASADERHRTLLVYLVLAIVFTGLMGLAGGRRSPHYVMVAFAALDVAAAAGFMLAYQAFSRAGAARLALRIAAPVGGLLLLFHALSGLPYYPYYYSYANPVMAALVGLDGFETGYGEVLEQAAGYLREKPEPENLTVLSWYAIGPFSYFFPGTTELLAPGADWSQSKIDRLGRSDYLVIYYHHQRARNMPVLLMRHLAGAVPEHVIWRNGIEYVRIYRVADLPESVWTPDPAPPAPH